jgi:hypothetical protein
MEDLRRKLSQTDQQFTWIDLLINCLNDLIDVLDI